MVTNFKIIFIKCYRIRNYLIPLFPYITYNFTIAISTFTSIKIDIITFYRTNRLNFYFNSRCSILCTVIIRAITVRVSIFIITIWIITTIITTIRVVIIGVTIVWVIITIITVTIIICITIIWDIWRLISICSFTTTPNYRKRDY